MLCVLCLFFCVWAAQEPHEVAGACKAKEELPDLKRHAPGALQHVVLENAWVFAPEDAISASVKAFLEFEKRLLEPIPKAERSKFQLTDISGAAWPRPGLSSPAGAPGFWVWCGQNGHERVCCRSTTCRLGRSSVDNVAWLGACVKAHAKGCAG